MSDFLWFPGGYDRPGKLEESQPRLPTLAKMNTREKLQLAYELAFHPARLNEVWNRVERKTQPEPEALREAADWAAALHQRLPEAPDVSARALKRLAAYQAASRLF